MAESVEELRTQWEKEGMKVFYNKKGKWAPEPYHIWRMARNCVEELDHLMLDTAEQFNWKTSQNPAPPMTTS